ncbi:beta-ketoacyl synthase [Parahaliea maris]|uniref:Beta-ketoacyl synthase n=1 Tax=Parahaliea maris TaxID=2716870 RepID=A0A5C8ZWC4_9GAMM|nr:beta-ketoacyl synthase [Parahaliea maris]TXS92728.1 beta-ketoacyl synthase [Parahaliea maris]
MSAQRLPVIVGFGGINGAGRASSHHAYRRLVQGSLPQAERDQTFAALARLMGLEAVDEQHILDHTLVRRVELNHFDVDRVQWNRRFPTQSNGQPVTFDIKRQYLPEVIPPEWEVTPTSVTHANVKIRGQQEFLLPTIREFEVKAAGQLPTGFEPGKLYASRNHPRGLQMMVYAASDALGSLGLDWEHIASKVPVDQVSVYAGSAMGQLDGAGAGGMLKARYNGQRVTSKFCPLSLAEMPADFVNAYVLGSLGSTGASLGACASFLYNLRLGINDIRSGRARVAFIGSAEAPINPEVMEGYAAMGALATDKGLRALDGLDDSQAPDHRRACRPFADNCGFTIAESAQMVVLFDDALALETGATMFGAAPDVFVNADGFKKSISGPGVGNYLTMTKALAGIRAIIGERAVRSGGLVQAHGTGTPQNRVTESRILEEVARAFGIEQWPVAAIKCFLGHSLGSASGDQVTATLGVWAHGLVPGITTVEEFAEDVHRDHLSLSTSHQAVDPQALHYTLVNSKGFGGNNATASLLSPNVTRKLVRMRASAAEWQAWEAANEGVRERQAAYDAAMIAGDIAPTYHFDYGVLGDDDVTLGASDVQIGPHRVSLETESPFGSLNPDD